MKILILDLLKPKEIDTFFLLFPSRPVKVTVLEASNLCLFIPFRTQFLRFNMVETKPTLDYFTTYLNYTEVFLSLLAETSHG